MAAPGDGGDHHPAGLDGLLHHAQQHSWPAQALSYKLGEIRIVALRAEAEKELGSDFDIRAFHDALLAQGSVPLPVLDQQIRQFIADRKAAASRSATPADQAVH